jgi:hypothetical protein
LRFDKTGERVTQEGRVADRYRVSAQGVPENKVFAFKTWPVTKTIVSVDPRDVYANTQGLLMIHKPTPEQEMSRKAGDDELEITPVTGSAEPMRYLLSSLDGQVQVFGTLVPHPVVANDHGCRLEVRIAQPDATAVLLIADGFPEKAKINLILESEGVAVNETLVTNANGHAVIADFPYAAGKTQGTLKAAAEGPGCLPSVVLPWGPATPAAPKAP